MPTFLVNQSFFVRDIKIPNLDHTPEYVNIQSSISKYEPQCLLKILGYPLFKLFGSETSQRMTDLLEGAEYTDGQGELNKWQGLVHDTDISLIANYIYFYHKEDNKAQSTGTGTSLSKAESGFAISPADKMAKAWNFFSSEVEAMTSFLWIKKLGTDRVYPEFSFHQFCETRRISRRIDSVFSF